MGRHCRGEEGMRPDEMAEAVAAGAIGREQGRARDRPSVSSAAGAGLAGPGVRLQVATEMPPAVPVVGGAALVPRQRAPRAVR